MVAIYLALSPFGVTMAEEAKFVELSVYPSTAMLEHAHDYQSVVAVAKRDDGVSVDVTDKVEWQLESATNSATLDDFVLRPAANGQGVLKAKLGDLAAQCDVTVATIENVKPVSYRHDVIPVLVRAGCNSGACHGSSRGKDGFRLSLFGFDPAGDYERLTREMSTRRINRALPDDSLLLVKAVGSVPHTGGRARHGVLRQASRLDRGRCAERSGWRADGGPRRVFPTARGARRLWHAATIRGVCAL
jgi:hypothetical protein